MNIMVPLADLGSPTTAANPQFRDGVIQINQEIIDQAQTMLRPVLVVSDDPISAMGDRPTVYLVIGIVDKK